MKSVQSQLYSEGDYYLATGDQCTTLPLIPSASGLVNPGVKYTSFTSQRELMCKKLQKTYTLEIFSSHHCLCKKLNSLKKCRLIQT